MKTYNVEIEFQDRTFRTQVEAETPHDAYDYVLDNVEVYVECSDEEWAESFFSARLPFKYPNKDTHKYDVDGLDGEFKPTY